MVHKRKIFFNKQVYLKHYSIKYGNIKCVFDSTKNKSVHFNSSRTLADNDKDGRLTSDEFVIAMHCCDIIRAGQTLPARLPDEWSKGHQTPIKPNINQTFASLNPDLKALNTNENHSPETVEQERKNSIVTYEEKRQKNYEVCTLHHSLHPVKVGFHLGWIQRIGTPSTIVT